MPQSSLTKLIQSDRLAERLIPSICALRDEENNDQIKSIHLEFTRRGLKKLLSEVFEDKENRKDALTYSRRGVKDYSANGERSILSFKEDLAKAMLKEVKDGYSDEFTLTQDEIDFLVRPYSNTSTAKKDNPYSSDAHFN